ncbi:MAG: hypothetical protein ACU843_18525, partial [Gammaproteobacteria bacterium]
MNSSFFPIRNIFLVLICMGVMASNTWAATINATSCSLTAVSSAISNAAAGDTVQVPAGSCSWSGLTINKPIHLKGAGVGVTTITPNGNSIIKQPNGNVILSGFSFTRSNATSGTVGWQISGTWLTSEPVIIRDNAFTVSNAEMFRLYIVGGAIFSNNSFTGGWDDSFLKFQHDNDTEGSWTRADTLGNRDPDGKHNIYVEGNRFYGGTNQGTDCSSNTRCVYRYNDYTNSSINSHGAGSLTLSNRHFEIYNNTWHYNGPSGQPATPDISAQGWAVWIRGATGVIFDNTMDDIKSQWWGDAAEYKFTIRDAEDYLAPGKTCGNTTYPALQQLGQNHNGANYFRDPIYLWNNTVAGNPLQTTQIFNNWAWGNPCGFNWNTFFQWGRDAVLGTAKPGYAPYPYPHPL